MTAVAVGAVDISATYQDVAGRGHVNVERMTFEIVGNVHEGAPTQDVRLGGARVEVVGGALDGGSTTTDASGNFRLAGVANAGFALKFKKPGYDDVQYDVVSLPRDATPNIALLPTAAIVTTDRSGTSECPNGSDSFMFPIWEFPVHRSGPVRLIAAENMGWGVNAIYIDQVSADGTVRPFWGHLEYHVPLEHPPCPNNVILPGLPCQASHFPPPGGPPTDLVGGFKYRIKFDADIAPCGLVHGVWTNPN